MAEFSLTILCHNAAFEGRKRDEVAAILMGLARRMSGDEKDSWALFDSNGNRVGIAELRGDAFDYEKGKDNGR